MARINRSKATIMDPRHSNVIIEDVSALWNIEKNPVFFL
jgi:hypothetical protein